MTSYTMTIDKSETRNRTNIYICIYVDLPAVPSRDGFPCNRFVQVLINYMSNLHNIN